MIISLQRLLRMINPLRAHVRREVSPLIVLDRLIGTRTVLCHDELPVFDKLPQHWDSILVVSRTEREPVAQPCVLCVQAHVGTTVPDGYGIGVGYSPFDPHPVFTFD